LLGGRISDDMQRRARYDYVVCLQVHSGSRSWWRVRRGPDLPGGDGARRAPRPHHHPQ
jgi:hypothetical protein